MWRGYKTSEELSRAIEDARVYELRFYDLCGGDLY